MSEFIGKLDFIKNPPTKEDLELAAEFIQKLMTEEERYKKYFLSLWHTTSDEDEVVHEEIAYKWFKIGYELAEMRAQYPPVSTDDSEVDCDEAAAIS